ncbi:MAG: PQQ-like beta-propeller repeat protein [Candidatus Sericytochromatia bacterium]|nr:PQQ-like beta-propeller repeat protein [Candidatus Sericytochromatia bacterium]
MPGTERALRNPETSGGLSSDFAKNLPGADAVKVNPSTPVVIGTTSYFLTESKTSVNFFALNANGQVDWELSLHENGYFAGSSAAQGKAHANTLYAISNQGRLYAVNASSGLVTNFVQITEDEFEYTSPFVVNDGGGTDSIYLTSKKGRVYRYTFNGNSFTQSFRATPVTSSSTGVFSASPVVTSNHIYVGSEEGRFYKLNRTTGATVSSLDLYEAPWAEGCQVKAALVIDATQDIGLVPCGSFLFKLRLNDVSTTAISLLAQSPMLELRNLITLVPNQVLGPNHNNRPQLETTVLRDPEPAEDGLAIEQTFGFKAGDFVRVESSNRGMLYGEIEEISEEGELSFKGDGLYPLREPIPEPLLFGTEKLSLANMVVRPTPFPDPDEPVPTPTPSPAGSDPVTRFVIGQPDGLSPGDYIRFPTLPGTPVRQICTSTHPDCDNGSGGKYAGIEEFFATEDAAEDEFVYRVTVPGNDLEAWIDTALNTTRFVPIERVQNQVVTTSLANSTQAFSLGSVKDFKAGDTIRISHRSNSPQGRFEYSVIESVDQTNRRIQLQANRTLRDAPQPGAQVEIITPNDRAYGRVLASQRNSSGNILSEPVLRGNGQQVYVQHGNILFESNYGSDSSFRDSANYLLLQSARLEQSNQGLTALSRSRPLVLDNDKLLTVDTDITRRTGIFVNRVLLPLSTSVERINDVFPILAPDSLGLLPQRAETRPVLLGTTGFFAVGGGNGVAYKLHKDLAW